MSLIHEQILRFCCLLLLLTSLQMGSTQHSRSQTIESSQSLTGNHFEPPKFENVFEAHLTGLRPGLRRAGVHTGGLEPLKNEADWPVIIKRNLLEPSLPVAAGAISSHEGSASATSSVNEAVGEVSTAFSLDSDEEAGDAEAETHSSDNSGQVPVEVEQSVRTVADAMKEATRSRGRTALLSSLRSRLPEMAAGDLGALEGGDESGLVVVASSAPANEDATAGEPTSTVMTSDSNCITTTPSLGAATANGSNTTTNVTTPNTNTSTSMNMSAAAVPSTGNASSTASNPLIQQSQTSAGPVATSTVTNSPYCTSTQAAGAITNVSENTTNAINTAQFMNSASSSNLTSNGTTSNPPAPGTPTPSAFIQPDNAAKSRIRLFKAQKNVGAVSKLQTSMNEDDYPRFKSFRANADNRRLTPKEAISKDNKKVWESNANLELEDSKGSKPFVSDLKGEKVSEIVLSKAANKDSFNLNEDRDTKDTGKVKLHPSSSHFDLDPSSGPIQLTLDPRNGSLTIKTEETGGPNSSGMQVSMSITGKNSGVVETNLPQAQIEIPKGSEGEDRTQNNMGNSRKLSKSGKPSFDVRAKAHRGVEVTDDKKIDKEVKRNYEVYDREHGNDDDIKFVNTISEKQSSCPIYMQAFASNKGKGNWEDSRIQKFGEHRGDEQWKSNNMMATNNNRNSPVAEVEVNPPHKEGVRIIAPGGHTTVQVKATDMEEGRRWTSTPPISRRVDEGSNIDLDISSGDTNNDRLSSQDGEHTLVVDGIVIKVTGSHSGVDKPLKKMTSGSGSNGRIRGNVRSREGDSMLSKGKITSGRGRDDTIAERTNPSQSGREKLSGTCVGSCSKKASKTSKKQGHNSGRAEERRNRPVLDESTIVGEDISEPTSPEDWTRWEEARAAKECADSIHSSPKSDDAFEERPKSAKERHENVRYSSGGRGELFENPSSKAFKRQREGVTKRIPDSLEMRDFQGLNADTSALKQDAVPRGDESPSHFGYVENESQDRAAPARSILKSKISSTKDAAMNLLMKSKGENSESLGDKTKDLVLKLQPTISSNIQGSIDDMEKGLHSLKAVSGESDFMPFNNFENQKGCDKRIQEKQRILYHRQDIENIVKRADSQVDQAVHISKSHNAAVIGQNMKPQIKDASQEDSESDNIFRENPLDMMEKGAKVDRNIRSFNEIHVKKKIMNAPNIIVEEKVKQRSIADASDEEKEDWEGLDLNTGNNNYYAERAFPAIVNPEDSFVNTEANILGAPFQRQQRPEMDAAQAERSAANSRHATAFADGPVLWPALVAPSSQNHPVANEEFLESVEKYPTLLSSDYMKPLDTSSGTQKMAMAGVRGREESRVAAPLPLPFFSMVTMGPPSGVAEAALGAAASAAAPGAYDVVSSDTLQELPPPVPAPSPHLVSALPALGSAIPGTLQETLPTANPTATLQLLLSQPPPPLLEQSSELLATPAQIQLPEQPLLSGVPSTLSELTPPPGPLGDASSPVHPLPPMQSFPTSFTKLSTVAPPSTIDMSASTASSTFIPTTSNLLSSNAVTGSRTRATRPTTSLDMLPAAAAAVSAAASLVGLGMDRSPQTEDSSARGDSNSGHNPPVLTPKKHPQNKSTKQNENTPPAKQVKFEAETSSEETWRRLNSMLQNEVNTGDLDGATPLQFVRGIDRDEKADEKEGVGSKESASKSRDSTLNNNSGSVRTGEPEDKFDRSGGARAMGNSRQNGRAHDERENEDEEIANTVVHGGGSDGDSDIQEDQSSKGMHGTQDNQDSSIEDASSEEANNVGNKPEETDSDSGEDSGSSRLISAFKRYGDGVFQQHSKKSFRRLHWDRQSTSAVPAFVARGSQSSLNLGDELMKSLPGSTQDILKVFEDIGMDSDADSQLSPEQAVHTVSRNAPEQLVVAAEVAKKAAVEEATPAGPGYEERRLHGGGGLTAERSLTARLGKIWHAAHFHHASSPKDPSGFRNITSLSGIGVNDRSTTVTVISLPGGLSTAASSPHASSMSHSASPWDNDFADEEEVHSSRRHRRAAASGSHSKRVEQRADTGLKLGPPLGDPQRPKT